MDKFEVFVTSIIAVAFVLGLALIASCQMTTNRQCEETRRAAIASGDAVLRQTITQRGCQ